MKPCSGSQATASRGNCQNVRTDSKITSDLIQNSNLFLPLSALHVSDTSLSHVLIDHLTENWASVPGKTLEVPFKKNSESKPAKTLNFK